MSGFVRRWGGRAAWAFGVVAALVGLAAYGDQVGGWYVARHLNGYAQAADVGALEQRTKAVEGKVDALGSSVDTLTRVVLEGRLAEVQGKILTLVGRRNLSPAEVEYLGVLQAQERTLKAELRKRP